VNDEFKPAWVVEQSRPREPPGEPRAVFRGAAGGEIVPLSVPREHPLEIIAQATLQDGPRFGYASCPFEIEGRGGEPHPRFVHSLGDRAMSAHRGDELPLLLG